MACFSWACSCVRRNNGRRWSALPTPRSLKLGRRTWTNWTLPAAETETRPHLRLSGTTLSAGNPADSNRMSAECRLMDILMSQCLVWNLVFIHPQWTQQLLKGLAADFRALRWPSSTGRSARFCSLGLDATEQGSTETCLFEFQFGTQHFFQQGRRLSLRAGAAREEGRDLASDAFWDDLRDHIVGTTFTNLDFSPFGS